MDTKKRRENGSIVTTPIVAKKGSMEVTRNTKETIGMKGK